MSNSDPSSTSDNDPARAPGAQPEAPDPLQQKWIKQEFERLKGLDTGPTRRRWQEVVGIAIVLLVIALLVIGIIAALGYGPFVIARRTDAINNQIDISSTEGEYVLILVGRGAQREVKLINSKTGAVQDLSQGDTSARQAALSPHGDKVAIVSIGRSGAAIYLINISGGRSRVFDGSALDAAAKSTFSWPAAQICDWSKLYWSPEADRLAFFGCSEQTSALFVVPTQPDVAPVAMRDTSTASGSVRGATWLAGGKIVITSGGEPTDALQLIDIARQSQQRLYGPLP